MDDALSLPILLPVGFLIGGIGTLVGLGGGFLLVPFLRLASSIDPLLTVGTSLFAVFFNSLSASATFVARRRADLRMAAWYAAATIPGALVGVELARLHRPGLFDLSFGALMLLAAWRTSALVQRNATAETAEGARETAYRRDLKRGLPVSFGAGIFSSVFGVGGGAIHVPFMVLAVGVPVHIASATSQCILAATTLVSSVRYEMLGQIDYAIGIPVAISMVIGGQCGAWVSERVRGGTIRRVLAAFLVLVGLYMMWRGIGT